MNRPRTVRLGITALLLALAACAPAYRGEPLTGPLELDAPTLVLGQRVFDAICHSCHPGGAGGLGPSLNDKPAGSAHRLSGAAWARRYARLFP